MLETSHALVERPQSYEDLKGRQAFVAPLDHELHKLKAVLTDYHFAQQVPCGLKGCRQPHNHGFLVSTESGAETNVGKDCGRSYFGDEVFSSAHSDYEKRRQRADLIDKLRSIQHDSDQIAARAKDCVFRKFGGKWTRKVQTALEAVVGGTLVQSLRFAHERGELAVSRLTERTDEEIDEAAALQPGLSRERARYLEERLGVLEPMPWIDFDFSGRVLGPFVEDIRKLRDLDPAQLNTPKLKSLLKPFDRIDSEIEEVEAACGSALRFLSAQNLRLVSLWIPPHFKRESQALTDWIDGPGHQALLRGEPG